MKQICSALSLLFLLTPNTIWSATCFDKIKLNTYKCRLKFSDGVPRDPVVLKGSAPSARVEAQFDLTAEGADFPYSCSCGYTGDFTTPQFKQSVDTFFCGSLGGGFSGYVTPNGRNLTLEIATASGAYGIADCRKKRD